MSSGSEAQAAGLRRVWQVVRHNVHHHGIAVLVVACLVTVSKPLWAPVDDVVAVVGQAMVRLAAAVTATGADEPPLSGTAIVKLDALRFTTVYAGVSPLDRCKLTEDLRMLLEQVQPPLKTLAIDLDLSPTERGEIPGTWFAAAPLTPAAVAAGGACRFRWRGLGASYETLNAGARPAGALENVVPHEVERNCQCRLNGLLQQHARRLVLMTPGNSAHPVTQHRIDAWLTVHQRAGVKFGAVDLESTRGIYRLRTPSVTGQPLFADQVFGHANARAAPPNTTINSPIPFHGLPMLRQFGAPYELGDDKLTDALSGARTVLVGSGYTRDDEFATAVGVLDGVDLHAAMSVCAPPSKAGRQAQNLFEFVLKLLLGVLLLGPMLHWFWGRYYADVRSTPKHDSSWVSRGAYLWLLGMAAAVGLFFLAVAVVFPFVAGWVMASPCMVPTLSASFVVGLAVEAAVVQGHEVAKDNFSTATPANAHAGRARKPPANTRQRAHRGLLGLCGAALLAWTLNKLLTV